MGEGKINLLNFKGESEECKEEGEGLSPIPRPWAVWKHDNTTQDSEDFSKWTKINLINAKKMNNFRNSIKRMFSPEQKISSPKKKSSRMKLIKPIKKSHGYSPLNKSMVKNSQV